MQEDRRGLKAEWTPRRSIAGALGIGTIVCVQGAYQSAAGFSLALGVLGAVLYSIATLLVRFDRPDSVGKTYALQAALTMPGILLAAAFRDTQIQYIAIALLILAATIGAVSMLSKKVRLSIEEWIVVLLPLLLMPVR